MSANPSPNQRPPNADERPPIPEEKEVYIYAEVDIDKAFHDILGKRQESLAGLHREDARLQKLPHLLRQ